jgi:hypothetical protein
MGATRIAKKLPPMRVATIKTLKNLFALRNIVKSKRMSAVVVEGIGAKDWYEQLLVTVARDILER